jgi:hypothetical protein
MAIFWRLKMKNYLVMLILLILLSTSVFALTATTLSGMIQMRLDSVPTTFEKSIGVKNDNNQTVLVKFTPSPDIKDQVVMEAYNITLSPNETRFVKFNLTMTEMKRLSSKIVIVFSDPNIPESGAGDEFALSTTLVVVPTSPNVTSNVTVPVGTNETNGSPPVTGNSTGANESEPPVPEPERSGSIAILAAGLVFLLIAVIIFITMRKGAKNE